MEGRRRKEREGKNQISSCWSLMNLFFVYCLYVRVFSTALRAGVWEMAGVVLVLLVR